MQLKTLIIKKVKDNNSIIIKYHLKCFLALAIK